MSSDPVAVVGLALRVPDAGNAEEFWANLVAGRNSVHRLTEEHLLAAGETAQRLADPNYVPARPLLDDVDGFDNRFFGISARESELRNPQHRLYLELCATALQDAGYEPTQFDGEIGVYGGAAYDRYAEDHIRASEALLGQVGEMVTNVSNNIDYLCTYVSYRLGLRGPSVSVRTACSTSLVAIHLACQAVLRGDCDMALAGGVEIEMPYGRGYIHVDGSIDARDGVCRPLDADASGTVFGSGGGVVVLKRLADALADGDRVIAVIRGSAINNDGPERSAFTNPNAQGQARVIGEALAVADVDPATVSYVELHGTGTVVGDPIEVDALNRAFRTVAERDLGAGSCAIGSVKSNIGHLGPASGVIGVIKVALALHHEQLPPTINVRRVNPALRLDTTPFRVADRLAPWRRVAGQPRRAGVSSFGFGGTNAHLVLEEPAPSPPVEDRPERAELVVWSGVDGAAEAAVRAGLARALAGMPPDAAADVAFTTQVGRRPLAVRGALRVTDLGRAAEVLGDPGARVTAHGDGTHRGAVFLFPGQGSQQPRAAVGLAARLPNFDRRVRSCLGAFSDLLGIDLVRLWQEERDGEVVAHTLHAQPLLFAVEFALAETLAEFGVPPTAVAGHSVGELVAATVAGVFSPEDAVRVVARRAQLMQALPPGRMLALAAGQDQVRELLVPGVWISAINSARQVVVGGAAPDIDRFRDRLADHRVTYRELSTQFAFHTPMMAPALAELTTVVEGCALREPRLPLLSAGAGAPLAATSAADPRFWAAQLVEPVNFHAVLGLLRDHPASLLLEVGPGHALTGLARQDGTVSAGGHRTAGTQPRPGRDDEWDGMLDALAQAWTCGATVDWTRIPRAGSPRRVALPTYPYQRRSFWLPRLHRGPAQEPTGTDTASPPPVAGEPPPVAGEPPPVAGEPAVVAAHPGDPVTVLPGWCPGAAMVPIASGLPGARGHALVFAPADPQRARYVTTAVQLLGYRVVAVRIDAQPRLRPHDCAVRAGHAGDLADLVAFLEARGVEPTLCVYASTPDRAAQPAQDDDAADAVLCELWSVVQLVRAMASRRRVVKCRVPVLVLSEGAVDVTGAEEVVPARAALTGLVRSAALELGAGSVRQFDVRGASEAVLAGAIEAPRSDEAVVALRGHRQWLPDRTQTMQDGVNPSLLVRGGVYLVTGGLGALGLAVAQGLADTGLRPRLVLLGRRAGDLATTHRVAEDLAGLRAAGADVELVAADVADKDGMRAVFDRLLRAYGRLDGVLHAAGVAGGGLVEARSRSEIAAVLRPKVTGSLVLRNLLAGVPGLRFLVFFSSRAALNGLLGSADYAAANAFQDALAATTTQPGLIVRSVNWPAWRHTGMAALDPTFAAGEVPTDEQATCWSTAVMPTDWVVADHLVAGAPVLPGAAHVDFLVRAVRALPDVDEFDTIVIEDLAVVAPVRGDQPMRLTVRLVSRPDGWEAVVDTLADLATRPVRCATARVRVTDSTAPSTVDVAELMSRWPSVPTTVPRSADEPFRFGPRFDCVTELRGDSPEADVLVGRLDLAAEHQADLDEYAVHPALLDRALALRLSVGGQVPFACRRVVVHGDLPGQLVVRVHARHADARRLVVDAVVYDLLGREVLSAEGFTKVPVDHGRLAAASGPSGIGLTSGITVDDGVRTMLRLLSERVPTTVAVVPANEWPAAAYPSEAPAPAAAAGPPVPDGVTEVARVWAETLGLPEVRPTDDFFELGGDSLTAVQLISRLRDRLGRSVSLADLFENPTPESLGAALLVAPGHPATARPL